MPVLSRSGARLLKWLVGGVAVTLGLYLLVFGLNKTVLSMPLDFTRYFDLNRETTLPTWYNTGLLTLGAVAALLAGVRAPDRRERQAWMVLAAAVAFLSLDEAVMIHEKLPLLLGMDRTFVTHEWLIPGAVVVVVGLTALALLLRPLPSPVKGGLLVAVVVYGTGALVVEGVSGYFVRLLGGGQLLELVILPGGRVLEEGLEMCGAALAVAVVVSHLDRSGVLERAQSLASQRSV